MEIDVPADLRAICERIVRECLTDAQWAEIEAGDYFQKETVHGGYEADEGAFTFSWYAPDGEEYWVTLTLDEVGRVARGETRTVEVAPADTW